MRKIILSTILCLSLLGFFGVAFLGFVNAQETEEETSGDVVVDFFYSKYCPHCTAENEFLDSVEGKYPQIEINRHDIADADGANTLMKMARECNAEKYIGVTPLTFVNGEFIVGFDNPDGIGRKIEELIQRHLESGEGSVCKPDEDIVNLPFIGEIDTSRYSLPILTVVLGILDGFNVCSLGALFMILGLVLALRSRTRILVFGGVFIFTTAVIYGLLIVLWHQLFTLLAPFDTIMAGAIGLLCVGGGIYFFRQFIKSRKKGPTCEMETGQIVATKFSSRIKESLQGSGNVFAIIGSILLFAAIITIVEFPCSAAVPVVFAGILAKAGLSSISYLFYISLFILFYMLDELVVFFIAFGTMKLWLTSNKFVIWITLLEAIVLFSLGIHYLVGL